MFSKIAGFEFRYQLRNPVFWVVVLLFAFMAFATVALASLGLFAVFLFLAAVP